MLKCIFCDEYIILDDDYVEVVEGTFHVYCYDRYIQECVNSIAGEYLPSDITREEDVSVL
jgi:hypothetical protein